MCTVTVIVDTACDFFFVAADKRYELFRKLQEAKPNMRVHPPSKKKPNNRVEYFSGMYLCIIC